jgi:outer membrane protein assembly factor BamE (lipoprotein component of BamABCDE complex)
VTRNSSQLAFLTPKPTSQSIIIISFNDAGGVTKVERDGLNKIVAVKMSGDKTPTLGRDSSLIQDLFGNIGQVSSGGGPASSSGGTGRDGPK